MKFYWIQILVSVKEKAVCDCIVHKTFQSQTPLFLSHQMGKLFVFGFPNFSIKIRMRVQENKIRESCTLLTFAKFISKNAILKKNRRGTYRSY